MVDCDQTFEAHRIHLRALAYRMTGSLVEAEDILQEAYLKWRATLAATPGLDVRDTRAYLSTLVTRLCIDWLKSARVRRETYVGPWLPEPVLDVAGVRPDIETELAQDITVALLMALERLSPLERAAFLLHDVFDVDYAQVANTLGRSEAACRQLTARARAAVKMDQPRYNPTESDTQRVLAAFATAASGNLEPLREVLAHDVVFYSDGGGRVSAATRPVIGKDRVVKFIGGLVSKFYGAGGLRVSVVPVNGMPGFVLFVADHVEQTVAFDIKDGLLAAVYAVRNPEKLSLVGEVSGAKRVVGVAGKA